MLTGVVIWAIAHLLVNGDPASLVLFGWLGAWAVVDHGDDRRVRRLDGAGAGAGRRSGSVIRAGVIVAIHTWLGYRPFRPDPMRAYRYLTDVDTAAFCHKVTRALAAGGTSWQPVLRL